MKDYEAQNPNLNLS